MVLLFLVVFFLSAMTLRFILLGVSVKLDVNGGGGGGGFGGWFFFGNGF